MLRYPSKGAEPRYPSEMFPASSGKDVIRENRRRFLGRNERKATLPNQSRLTLLSKVNFG